MVWNLTEESHLTFTFPAFPAPGHPQTLPNLPSAAPKSGPLSQELGLKKLLVDQQRRFALRRRLRRPRSPLLRRRVGAHPFDRCNHPQVVINYCDLQICNATQKDFSRCKTL